ncbi:hypothetical protein CROQUDRAFT_82912 [Cronartium quercuum f. sp. fusiforme G11]|uniref:Uncharacterized protein n=1 Tax=Cronartium quercuum f. sp. fusiforme G11 TaxID=708437 RepID=A0A9P6N8C7_9BASI|nr:hypothetical protein CROQUDRAFT_82912 [Cronartium quercuum f. sp. fusiforme G11]
MVALKSASVSPKYGTECNSTYGDCGCDNCRGQYLDLSYRLRVFRERRHHLGKDRTMQLWAVPQAFSDPDYWSRAPTGDEFLLICTIYLIEGAVGLMGWQENAQTSQDYGSAKFGKALPAIMPFLGLPQAFLPIPPSTPYPNDTLIARVWPNSEKKIMLVMVANLIEKPARWSINPPQSISLPQGPLGTKTLYITEGQSPTQVNVQGNSISLTGTLQGLGCGAWLIPM